MSELQIERPLASARNFARYHRLRLPVRGQILRLGQEFASGAFGRLHRIEPEPGSPGPATVAKVFGASHAAEADRVARLIAGLNRRLERCGDREWPRRLLALPFALATARFEGELRTVALMIDLQAQGYEKWELEGEARGDYQERGPLDRLEFAYNFARSAALLESVSFLHADVNLSNLLFREADCDVQIIDFDGGVVVETGDERPLAAGKRDDFLPPEAKRLGADPDKVSGLLTLEAERWSVGLMVGLLLFGIEPHFFLSELSASNLDAYARQARPWPAVDVESDVFLAANRIPYEECLPRFEAAPGDAPDRFADFFSAGSNGAFRPTAAAWVKAMEIARTPPEFEFLRAEPDVQVEGSEVLVSWNAPGAESVKSKEFGTLADRGSERFVVGQGTRFTLEAVNRYGAVTAMTNPVRVVPLPRIERIPIPAFPGFQARLKIAGPAQVLPSPPLPPPRFHAGATIPARAAGGLPRLRPDAVRLPRLPSFGSLLGGFGSAMPSGRGLDAP